MAARPKYTTESTIRFAGGVLTEAKRIRNEIEERLSPGLLDGLETWVPQLRAKTDGAVTARTVKEGSTLTQALAHKNGAEVVVAIRKAVKAKHGATSDVAKKFGVGKPLNQTVKAVTAALDTVLKAAKEEPEQARAAGILASDLAEAQEAYDALVGSDAAQEGKKLTAKQATAARTALQLDIEQAIEEIVGVVELKYRKQPEVVARFTSLRPGSPAKKPAKPEPKPQ